MIASPEEQPAPDQTTTEVATGQLKGTALAVDPRIEYYETAVLRVSGPDNYTLTKRFEANASIRVDLLSEGAAVDDGRDRDSGRLETLPSGQYNYEIVFTDRMGQQSAHSGSFQIP